MSVELLQLLSTVFFVLSAVLFLVAVALFFYLDVVHVIGDVTGSTARKAIEDIRKGNESSGNKAYKPSPVNKARGKLTDKISPSGQLKQRKDGLGVAVGTAKLSVTEVALQGDNTNVIDTGANETTLLDSVSNETTVLSQSNETAVLSYVSNETTILNQLSDEISAANNFTKDNNQQIFAVEFELCFVGTDELIE